MAPINQLNHVQYLVIFSSGIQLAEFFGIILYCFRDLISNFSSPRKRKMKRKENQSIICQACNNRTTPLIWILIMVRSNMAHQEVI